MSKLSETMDYLLGSCMPKVDSQEDELSDAPKDDNYRKQELKQLVGIFASRAQKYIDCIRISLENNQMLRSFYKLDSKLTTFSIMTNDVVEDIPISSMTAILNYDDVFNRSESPRSEPNYESETSSRGNRYDELLNNEMILRMNLQQKNRFVLIEYESWRGSERLLMLVEEVGNSDPFVTVLRILKMHSNSEQ
ncbi:hypothetical protein MACK_000529 [Theileria orientalis]|uniref:Uncharacterized protein n=1 Tax=Theileria orientalis TaxID=68886 RepID=A0A976M9R4_THEOR|nr:hypothetical protein MACK_000529 [Theileria orientalis]